MSRVRLEAISAERSWGNQLSSHGQRLRCGVDKVGTDIVKGGIQAFGHLCHTGDDAESEHSANHRVLDQILTLVVAGQIPELKRQLKKQIVHD